MATVRVLHIVGAMYPGGMENFIMNIYRKIDRNKVQFDFVIHMRKDNDYVELIRNMGGKVYELPRLTSHPIKNLKGIYNIVKNNEYKIVVRHTSNALITPQLMAAKRGGAYTICHSHNETDPNKLLHIFGRMLMPMAADERFACSINAGKWMYGSRKFRVIQNAIDINKFQYSLDKARKVIDEFGLEGKHVYGHIANFIESKNHMFLMEIYKKLSEIDKSAVFFCLGEGELRPEIELKIKSLGLENRVILTGIRHDVENFMSCFDVLIFPSIFEGLPLTVIEAQAAGLPCLISETITKDVVVSDGLVNFESIDNEAEVWAKRAVQLVNTTDRTCQRDLIAKAGYDSDAVAKWYEDYFLRIGAEHDKDQGAVKAGS
jgi:glycosyltransferase involved in cell wall biosynthesis